HAAVRRREQARLEDALALADGVLEVEGADQAVLRRANWQLDQRHTPRLDTRRVVARRALGTGIGRIAAVRTADDHFDLRQQPRERPHRGGLRGPLLSADQHSADARIDRVQRERLLQPRLTDQRGEREHGTRAHGRAPAGAASARPSRSPSASRYARRKASASAPGSVHIPRSIASSSRALMSRRAQGLLRRMNARTAGSSAYASATRAYIQSSTTFA